jgi:hypothetical protein
LSANRLNRICNLQSAICNLELATPRDPFTRR